MKEHLETLKIPKNTMTPPSLGQININNYFQNFSQTRPAFPINNNNYRYPPFNMNMNLRNPYMQQQFMRPMPNLINNNMNLRNNLNYFLNNTNNNNLNLAYNMNKPVEIDNNSYFQKVNPFEINNQSNQNNKNNLNVENNSNKSEIKELNNNSNENKNDIQNNLNNEIQSSQKSDIIDSEFSSEEINDQNETFDLVFNPTNAPNIIDSNEKQKRAKSKQ